MNTLDYQKSNGKQTYFLNKFSCSRCIQMSITLNSGITCIVENERHWTCRFLVVTFDGISFRMQFSHNTSYPYIHMYTKQLSFVIIIYFASLRIDKENTTCDIRYIWQVYDDSERTFVYLSFFRFMNKTINEISIQIIPFIKGFEFSFQIFS